jgi:hypothetical protein
MNRAIEQAIGPLERVLVPSSGSFWQALLGNGIGWLFIGGAGVVLGWNWRPHGSLVLAVLAFALPVSAWVIVAGLRTRRARLRRRLLVGEKGLAETRPNGPTVLLWDEVGVAWRVLPLAVHRTSSRTDLLLERVRAEVTRRFGPGSRMLKVHRE